MKTKHEIVTNWLPRYTGTPLENFGQYILLTNFANYVTIFADKYGVEIIGKDKPMQTATHENITIINFGMGSAMAATVMDLLSAIQPKAVLFLGKCGGLKKKNNLGDFVSLLLILSYHGGSRKTINEVSRMEIHDLIVFTATPISLDRWLALKICPIRPAHSFINFRKSEMFFILIISLKSLSTYVI